MGVENKPTSPAFQRCLYGLDNAAIPAPGGAGGVWAAMNWNQIIGNANDILRDVNWHALNTGPGAGLPPGGGGFPAFQAGAGPDLATYRPIPGGIDSPAARQAAALVPPGVVDQNLATYSTIARKDNPEQFKEWATMEFPGETLLLVGHSDWASSFGLKDSPGQPFANALPENQRVKIGWGSIHRLELIPEWTIREAAAASGALANNKIYEGSGHLRWPAPGGPQGSRAVYGDLPYTNGQGDPRRNTRCQQYAAGAGFLETCFNQAGMRYEGF